MNNKNKNKNVAPLKPIKNTKRNSRKRTRDEMLLRDAYDDLRNQM